MAYGIQLYGKQYTPEFVGYITKDEKVISPFHDIPIYVDQKDNTLVNVVNEIPRFTNAKNEICKETEYNPIKQDIKDGKVRFVSNMFPSKGYIWNYGAIPQTWESPEVKDHKTQCKGDNDPIDVIEIGERVIGQGEVYQGRIVGGLALLDGGECDWKIVVINSQDPMYSKIKDITDVEKYMPGLLKETVHWFKNYKVPAGGKQNEFGLDESYLNASEAAKVVHETHVFWQDLIKRPSQKKIFLTNTTQEGTPNYTTKEPQLPTTSYTQSTEPIQAQSFFYLK
ncbi:nucleosome-remodeling factor 38 kDa subunit [Nematocida sp. AWRm80]|nr:nucleosome-remodeling factor 38 kDa subunit [Nematocida sp. AWRm80]